MTGSRELRCAAGHVVGVRLGPEHAGLVAIRHHGREYIVYGVVVLRCDCGATWRPEAPTAVLADLEYKTPTLAGRAQ